MARKAISGEMGINNLYKSSNYCKYYLVGENIIKWNLLKKALCLGIIFLFIGTISIPVIGEKNTRDIQHLVKSGANQQNHTVFIYRYHGTSVKNLVKTITHENAMKIKKEYQRIEQQKLEKNKEWIQKQEVLKNYGLLDISAKFQYRVETAVPLLRLLKTAEKNNQYPNQGRFALLGIMGSVNGEFYHQTINFLNLRFAGLPLIIFGAGGCEIRLTDLLYLGQPQYLSTDASYLYCSLFFIGQITIAPFLDPDGGQIMGISLFTLVLGGK